MNKIKRKKILINASSGKEGGVLILIKNYIHYLKKDANNYNFKLYVSSKIFNEFNFIDSSNLKIKELKFFSLNPILRILWEQLILPLELIFYDGFYSITNTYPLLSIKKGGLLIHQPNLFSSTYINIGSFYKKLVRLSCTRADFIIVQTECIKNKLINQFKINDSKIKILPQGISLALLNIDETSINKNLKLKIKTFKDNNKFICLYVCLYTKYKNIELLVESIALLSKDIKKQTCLFLTLPEYYFKEYIEQIVIENDLNEQIINIGEISHNNLAYLYKEVDLFIYPSLLETFGLPLIEAMHFGLPILAADLDYAHNVCDNSIIYFNPYSKVDIAKNINLMIHNPEIRQKYSIKSLKQAQNYSWEKHMEALNKLILSCTSN